MAALPSILLTGATGYVGGRLLPELEKKKYPLRCLVRRPESLVGRVKSTTEVVQGDLLEESSLKAATAGIHTAYYLVHSLGALRHFESKEYQSAKTFAHACAKSRVQRIIYLGGLGEASDGLSAHLRSRQKVGELLLASGVPVMEFRASAIIGSGSLSFEMVRALVERLPVMITPRWVDTQAQPIAIEDVIRYLVEAISYRGPSKIFEIGGSDKVSYGDLMKDYARQRGLRRWMIPVPFLTPRLSSLWLGLVTPLYARVGRKLVESLRYPTVVSHPEALSAFKVRPLSCHEAIARALRNEDREWAATRWSDAVSSAGIHEDWKRARFATRRVDSRSCLIKASSKEVFCVVERIGGRTGWYYADVLWQARGILDLLFGGVGLRKGSRPPDRLRVGDALDFWRVEAIVPHERLRLRAEMKLPGRAWLEFEITKKGNTCELTQTALFDPLGLWGLVYWYLLYPAHVLIFSGMLRRIAEQAESTARDGEKA